MVSDRSKWISLSGAYPFIVESLSGCDPGDSAGWPRKRPAADHMTVKVEHTLPCIGSLIDDEPVTAVRKPERLGHTARSEEQTPGNVHVVGLHLGHSGDMSLRDDESMHRRDRADVAKRQNVIVLEDDVGRRRPGDDVAEEATIHDDDNPIRATSSVGRERSG
jgi:hypothetical protein